jgi:hypothetical protein
LALAIQKIMPYSRWLVMLLTVYIAQKLLVLTVFAELALLLPYIRYYIYYRLFRQAMQCDFLWVNQLIRASKLWNLRHQVDIATKTLGLSAFLIFSFLTAIESLIRRGLIYHLATRAMFDLGLLFAMGFAYQWRGVIGAGLGQADTRCIRRLRGKVVQQSLGTDLFHSGLFRPDFIALGSSAWKLG